MGYLRLEWWNSCDIAGIHYGRFFENKIFIDAEIGKPEFLEEEEGFENEEGVFITNYKKLIPVYRFEFMGPEYIVKAMKAMAMHDTILIGNELYDAGIRNVEVNATWDPDTNDCLALIEIKFRQDDQIIKNSCCE